MAQAVGRKTMLQRETVSRPPVKAILDTTGKRTKTRNKSSTKIPKTLRHDLEHALVNLCDIWFEEIKPHLMRNNIKLHLHEEQAGQAGGEGAKYLPPGAPGCSHLDPGAASDNHQRRNVSCADYSSEQRTASRAQCRRPPPPPQPPPRPTTPHLKPSPIYQNQYPNRKEGSKRRPRKRKHFRKHTQSEGRLRVPRLCHNLGLSPPPQPKSCQGKRNVRYHSEYINRIEHIRSKTKDQSTQTENSVNFFKSVCYNNPKPTVLPENKRVVSFHQNHPRKKEKVKSPLFEKDLINIICSENDKRLKLLYKSPSGSNISSIMNLIPDFETQAIKCKKKGRPRPWK